MWSQLKRIAEALERGNKLAEESLANQRKQLQNMEQLKKTSQALELNLMLGEDDEFN